MSVSSPPPSDLFVITPDQKAKYEIQFVQICPSRSDFITGVQAKNIMLASGLPPAVLAHIWSLADVDSDGKMDINEFSIALHLIYLKLKGIELPATLPQSLKVMVEAPPFAAFSDFGSFGQPSAPPAQPPVATNYVSAPPPPRPAPPVAAEPTKPVQRSGSITSSDYPNSMLLTEWAIPQPSKLKYTQQFNSHDRTRTGFLTGPQARNILIDSKLPQGVLAQIWNLSDIDSDGRLTCDEFVVAMHLIDCVRAGDTLPPVLTPDLVPPSYRRKMSLTGATAIPTMLPSMAPAIDNLSDFTFEDKRRENFEKGQAELDRRRLALLEIQKREREDRERKEREEHQKREQIRLELERKRQAELERQLQKQREIENEKEEQRRKQLEQREAARREMERQRMLEWENTRKQDLSNQKIKTLEELIKLKSKKKSLAITMEQVNNKLNELNGTVGETRKKVVDVKADIDSMRLQRDQKLGLLSSIKAQIKALNDKQLYIEQEKLNLAQQLKNTSAAAGVTNASSDQFALQNKQININQLKSQIETFEKERAAKFADLANNNTQLSELKDKFKEMIKKTNELTNSFENKRMDAQEYRDCHKPTKDETFGVPDVEWPLNNAEKTLTVTKVKYRCLYAFPARNSDELTIEPGDIVIVDTSACSEPGWLSGEVKGHVGWFPEAYVELMDGEPNQIPDETNFDVNQKHTLEGIEEAPENGNEPEVVSTKSAVQFTSSDDSSFEKRSERRNSTEPTTGLIKAMAQYAWKAKEDNHLSFSKGDIITIKEQQDMWWFGQLGTASGWFPKSYVRELDESGNVIQDDEYYISLYPFESQEPGDLSFDSNELIKVTKKDGEWWTGSIGDQRTGVFPSNYARLAQPEEMPNPVLTEPSIPAPKSTYAPPLQSQMSAPTPPPTSDGERRSSESCDSPKPSKKKMKKLEIVTVIAPYKATGAEQLSLEKNQLIQVRKKTSSGWWEGEMQIKGKKKQVGWFPASYVKLLNPPGGSGGSSARSTPDPVKQKASEDKDSEKVTAIYSFRAQHDDELSFETNDTIKVLAKEDTTWWKGQLLSTGAVGLFPSNHVEPYREQYEQIDNQYNEINNIYEECIPPNNGFPDGGDHQYDDEFEDDTTESESVYSITDDERKRQNHINEFIATEKAYVRDMEIVVDVFQKPLLFHKRLTNLESDAIFVNWPKLVKCNQKFLKALRNRKRSAIISNNMTIITEISDLFCHHLTQMSDYYIKYCSRQLTAARLIQNKTENDPKFKEVAKLCSQDSRANRLPLSSYLLKPMQRITKYPLLIGKILEHTPSNHSDYEHCQKALSLSQELCRKVNEACRTTEDSQHLEWIQRHVRIDGIDQNIVFNSETNCLGRRQLLHSGTLIKANSGRELIAFLFNDFLLLTAPLKELPKITNVFASERAQSSTYRIYKEPILLNDIIITELSQFESNLDPTLFQIYVNSQQKYWTLKAISTNERSLWVKSIDISSRHFRDIERLESSSEKSSHVNLSKLVKKGRLFVTVIEGLQLTSQNNVLNAFCKISIGRNEENIYQTHSTKVVRCLPATPTGERTLISRSSPSIITKNDRNIESKIKLFKVKWNDSTQLIIYEDIHNSLQIKCFDRNPFAPNHLIGSSKLSISELVEEISQIQGSITKEIRLSTEGTNINANPILYLKLDLQYFDK